jgi:hypothetical protein
LLFDVFLIEMYVFSGREKRKQLITSTAQQPKPGAGQ